MTALEEGDLRIDFPRQTHARKFDDASHGLSHCMKAVDFVVEEDDRILFIELKDPDHPRATEAARKQFVEKFLSARLDEELTRKFRDSLLYLWACGSIDKPVHYWIVVALEDLTEADLLAQTDCLKRRLPIHGPPSGVWQKRIVDECVVFNIRTWVQSLPCYPLRRVPA